MFFDRSDGGRQLAELLSAYRDDPQAIVLGIPRGGVVVAAEVARALNLPLDVAVAAKVGAPGNPEYAIGAVAPDGEVTPNPGSGFDLEQVRANSSAAVAKVRRYVALLRTGLPPLDVTGRTALLVDDGLATGLTAIAASDWVRRQGAARIVVAVPVASRSAAAALQAHADDVIAVDTPPGFYAVGQFYEVFNQTEDAEVIRILGGMGG